VITRIQKYLNPKHGNFEMPKQKFIVSDFQTVLPELSNYYVAYHTTNDQRTTIVVTSMTAAQTNIILTSP
jgi:hypothetical protein